MTTTETTTETTLSERIAEQPQLVVTNRETAAAYVPGDGEVCVSIWTPGDRAPVLSPRFAAVLGLSFADVPWADRPDLIAAHGIGDTDVARLVAFVRAHEATARRIVVHCTVGASRSVAVARAIHGALHCEGPIIRRWTDGREEPLVGPLVNRPLYVRVGRALAASEAP